MMKKIVYGVAGLYALLCFWMPVLWLTDTLMERHEFNQFRFEWLYWHEKIQYIVTFLMSMATTFIIFTSLKNEFD